MTPLVAGAHTWDLRDSLRDFRCELDAPDEAWGDRVSCNDGGSLFIPFACPTGADACTEACQRAVCLNPHQVSTPQCRHDFSSAQPAHFER